MFESWGVGPSYFLKLAILSWYQYQIRGWVPCFWKVMIFKLVSIPNWGGGANVFKNVQKSGLAALGWYPGPWPPPPCCILYFINKTKTEKETPLN